ncbi:MAG: exodeoxyribonuclease VII large subunit [Bacteroidia bacterium]|jgi:exodeoxyribonuclease VII large subunit|nr:exodeoxyribonuclease VII large subunit [Bacteroidia bacterium]MCC6768088.1 exodeoxyribonuclease VII large subunit [Bacteroidia bacterium]
MAIDIAGKKVFTLREVAQSIQRTLNERYKSTFWVKAELNKLNHYSHSGHCYPELLERIEGKVVAQFRSVLWKGDFDRINKAFNAVLKEPLKDGITILFEASIQYDPVYDLSLRIHDMDPSYSLGELERERLENIERLKKEGLFTRNKQLEFPDLPQRLAVISVETSKGYADFLKVIDQNPWGYKYFHFLFPALLQGEKAVDSIVAALKKIKHVQHHFDLVLIIRGGGGDIGLSCYNHYDLAREIALFPLPVLSGVGHATNETIAELVSFRHFITPTETATFLLQCFHDLSVPVENTFEKLRTAPGKAIRQKHEQFIAAVKYFSLSVRRTLDSQDQFTRQIPQRIQNTERQNRQLLRQQLDTSTERLKHSGGYFLIRQKTLLDSYEQQAKMLDPKLILKRGFSITMLNGKALTESMKANEGDVIETVLFKGKLISRVETKKK